MEELIKRVTNDWMQPDATPAESDEMLNAFQGMSAEDKAAFLLQAIHARKEEPTQKPELTEEEKEELRIKRKREQQMFNLKYYGSITIFLFTIVIVSLMTGKTLMEKSVDGSNADVTGVINGGLVNIMNGLEYFLR